MIDAKELMVGNWVNFYEDDTKFIVKEIHDSGIDVKNNIEETYIELDQFSGIDITAEILMKCAFVQRGYYLTCTSFSRLSFYVRGDKLDFQCFGLSLPFDVKYLHQLQNIHYALTGTELEINL